MYKLCENLKEGEKDNIICLLRSYFYYVNTKIDCHIQITKQEIIVAIAQFT